MEPGRTPQCMSQAEGVSQLLSQGERLAIPFEGLLRIAQIPQYPGAMSACIYPQIIPLPKGHGTVLPRVVKGNRLLLMCAGWNQSSSPVHGIAQRMMSPQKE